MNSASHNNNEDNKKTTSSPTSGDAISIDGKNLNSYGSLGIFVNHPGDNENLYATTCFHVLYNGEKLVDDDGEKLKFGKRFDIRKKECDNPNSTTSSTSYCFRSKADEKRTGETSVKTLGKFYAATYDKSHDLGIVKVDEGVACNYDIPDIFEYRLSPKSVLGQKTLGKNIHPDVFKIGFKTNERRGKLEQISFTQKKRGELVVRKAYLVKVEEGMKAFMENGDSGSLVVWKDEEDKKWPFAYCVKDISPPDSPIHERKYVCFSLIDSLMECDGNLQIKDNSHQN